MIWWWRSSRRFLHSIAFCSIKKLFTASSRQLWEFSVKPDIHHANYINFSLFLKLPERRSDGAACSIIIFLKVKFFNKNIFITDAMLVGVMQKSWNDCERREGKSHKVDLWDMKRWRVEDKSDWQIARRLAEWSRLWSLVGWAMLEFTFQTFQLLKTNIYSVVEDQCKGGLQCGGEIIFKYKHEQLKIGN